MRAVAVEEEEEKEPSLGPPPKSEKFLLSLELKRQKKFEESLELLVQAANENDYNAISELGIQISRRTLCTKKKFKREQAREYLKKAADAGVIQAQWEYKSVVHGGSAEGKEFRKKAKDSGDPYVLGCIYQSGEFGQEKDKLKAAECFQKAGLEGNIYGWWKMGSLLDDQKEAIPWYAKAAEAGDAYSANTAGRYCKSVGWILEAYKYMKIAADQGDSDAMKALKHPAYQIVPTLIACQKSCFALIAYRKFCCDEETLLLQILPKEIVVLIAQFLWGTRRQKDAYWK